VSWLVPWPKGVLKVAEITAKRQGELVRGVFQILAPEHEGLPVRDILRRLVAVVPPTEFESSFYENRPNLRRYDKIVRFSTIAPVKAGWLVKTKGSWSITEEGRRAFESFKDPEKFTREAGRLYRRWKDGQPDRQQDGTVDEEEGELSERRTRTLEEVVAAAWAEIQAYLEEMPPYDFQNLVAGLLRGMGYFVEWVSPPGPDRGIDIVAHADPLGVKGPRIKAQVKRRTDNTTVDDVRSFMSVLAGSDIGIYVSTGGFTRDAQEEVRRQEQRRIMLIDLERLFGLWEEHYERIPEAERRLLPLKRVSYLAPDDFNPE